MKKIVHIIEFQYLKDYFEESKNTIMHDLKAIYYKVLTCLNDVAKHYFDELGNHSFYPNRPKYSDRDIIALAISAECCQIDSENLLYSKLKTDYPEWYLCLPHRTRFNARRKRLCDLTANCLGIIADCISNPEEKDLIIDSMPITTCNILREHFSKACRRESYDELKADKGYNKIMRGYYIGYKFHLITTKSGIYKDFLITPASTHDNAYLKILDENDDHLRGTRMLGDRGYIGKAVQLSLFEKLDLILDIPYRRNQKDFKKYDFNSKITRKTIEVVFAQYTDEFLIKRNYAKRFTGFYIRILTKVIAKTFKQYMNFINGLPINRTKHALAA